MAYLESYLSYEVNRFILCLPCGFEQSEVIGITKSLLRFITMFQVISISMPVLKLLPVSSTLCLPSNVIKVLDLLWYYCLPVRVPVFHCQLIPWVLCEFRTIALTPVYIALHLMFFVKTFCAVSTGFYMLVVVCSSSSGSAILLHFMVCGCRSCV